MHYCLLGEQGQFFSSIDQGANTLPILVSHPRTWPLLPLVHFPRGPPQATYAQGGCHAPQQAPGGGMVLVAAPIQPAQPLAPRWTCATLQWGQHAQLLTSAEGLGQQEEKVGFLRQCARSAQSPQGVLPVCARDRGLG